MSHFYQELHNRELLSHALLVLRELEDRRMIDVFLPDDIVKGAVRFPRRLASISVENNRLALRVEADFFRKAATPASP